MPIKKRGKPETDPNALHSDGSVTLTGKLPIQEIVAPTAPTLDGNVGWLYADIADDQLYWYDDQQVQRSLTAGGSGSAGAPFNSIQYNNAGSFAGDDDFTWDSSTFTAYIGAAAGQAHAGTIKFGDDEVSIVGSGDGSNKFTFSADIDMGVNTITDAKVGQWDTAYGWGDWNGHNHTGVYEPANANIQSHISSTANPHGIDEDDVGHDTAQWNADRIQSVTVTAPVSGDDGEFLRYNYNGGSPTLTWEAAGGAAALLLDGSNNMAADIGFDDGAARSISIDAQGTTDTAGDALTIKAGDANGAADGGNLVLEAGSSADQFGGNVEIVAGDGQTGGGNTNKVEIYADRVGVKTKVADFSSYGNIGTGQSSRFFGTNTATQGVYLSGASGVGYVGYFTGTTGYQSLQLTPSVVAVGANLVASGTRNIGASDSSAFANGYFDATVHIGATSCPDGDRLELSNQSVKQDQSLTGVAGKALTIEAGSALDSNEDGGDLNLKGGTEHGSGEKGAVVVTGQIYSAQDSETVAVGTTHTIDFADGNSTVMDMENFNGAPTVTLSNGKAGGSYIIKIIQGSGGYDITWTTVLWAGGTAPTITATDNAVDIVSIYCDGTNYYGTIVQDVK